MDFLDKMKFQLNYTNTENGAVAMRSTLNPVLDAFSSLGAMRKSSDDAIVNVFKAALMADRGRAMRLLFYIRDVRGGQGERKVFRVIVRWLAMNEPELIVKNLENFLFYGRGDDLFCLFDTPVEEDVLKFIYDTIKNDNYARAEGQPCSLLAKWMPSENASSKVSKKLARKIAGKLGISMRSYRITMSALRKYIDVTERKMSAKQFSDIDYEKVPSRAHMIYANAFARHDVLRYGQYLNDVANGRVKVNASALFPVDIVHRVLTNNSGSVMDSLLNLQWNSLPNYLDGMEETGICVVDVSGSMMGTPIEVAISLGLYNADKCRGAFRGKFITFSQYPSIQEVRGETIREKVRSLHGADWGYNTNIEAVFDVILKTAIANHCKQNDMPAKLYIISDMQFDRARGSGLGYWNDDPFDSKTLMDEIRNRYHKHGYELPSIVYWNVRESNCGMYQQTYNGVDCCMVSGYSPSLFEAVIRGTEYVQEDGYVKQKLDPIVVMNTAIMNERYDRVKF